MFDHDSKRSYELPYFLQNYYYGALSMSMSFPSVTPSSYPSEFPTLTPSDVQSDMPSDAPSDAPSNRPSDEPTEVPSDAPSSTPTTAPTLAPTPSDEPTEVPSDTPSFPPTAGPTLAPTMSCYNSFLFCPGVSTCSSENKWQIHPDDYDLDLVAGDSTLECELRVGAGTCTTFALNDSPVVGSFVITSDNMDVTVDEVGYGIQSVRLSAPIGGTAPKILVPTTGSTLLPQAPGTIMEDYMYANAKICPCGQISEGCDAASNGNTTAGVTASLNDGTDEKTSLRNGGNNDSRMNGAKIPVIAATVSMGGTALVAAIVIAFKAWRGRRECVQAEHNEIASSSSLIPSEL